MLPRRGPRHRRVTQYFDLRLTHARRELAGSADPRHHHPLPLNQGLVRHRVGVHVDAAGRVLDEHRAVEAVIVGDRRRQTERVLQSGQLRGQAPYLFHARQQRQRFSFGPRSRSTRTQARVGQQHAIRPAIEKTQQFQIPAHHHRRERRAGHKHRPGGVGEYETGSRRRRNRSPHPHPVLGQLSAPTLARLRRIHQRKRGRPLRRFLDRHVGVAVHPQPSSRRASVGRRDHVRHATKHHPGVDHRLRRNAHRVGDMHHHVSAARAHRKRQRSAALVGVRMNDAPHLHAPVPPARVFHLRRGDRRRRRQSPVT